MHKRMKRWGLGERFCAVCVTGGSVPERVWMLGAVEPLVGLCGVTSGHERWNTSRIFWRIWFSVRMKLPCAGRGQVSPSRFLWHLNGVWRLRWGRVPRGRVCSRCLLEPVMNVLRALLKAWIEAGSRPTGDHAFALVFSFAFTLWFGQLELVVTVNTIPPVFSPVQASLVLVFRVSELNKPVKLRVSSVEQELEVYKASSEFVVCPVVFANPCGWSQS